MTGARFRFPKVEFGPEERALREEIREFIRAERASGGFTPMADSWGSGWSPEWSRKMGERGWLGMMWPKPYGGGERPALHRYIVTEEMVSAGRALRRALGRRPPVGAAAAALRHGGAAPHDPAPHRRRGVLLRHRHERAGFRFRPRLGPHVGRKGGRRLVDRRAQDLVLGRPSLALHDRAGPHRAP